MQVAKVRRATCYYEILGISRSATDDEIKRACAQHSLQTRPPTLLWCFHDTCGACLFSL